MVSVALVIVGLPLLAFILNVFVTRPNKTLSAWLAIGAVGVAMLLALFIIYPQVAAGLTDHAEITWLRLQPPNVSNPPTETFLGLGV
jgi:NADH:ubiquinone oxidoreductase subunit 5 (subunit L)/multisubunit Na+/H+ antiporter MnhA subunit